MNKHSSDTQCNGRDDKQETNGSYQDIGCMNAAGKLPLVCKTGIGRAGKF
jgi:hypothetical protein